MRILSIETSCDETAVSVVEASGTFPHATYTVKGNALFSQIDIHREYGGVFPAIAKREHAKTLVPMLEKALDEAKILIPDEIEFSAADTSIIVDTLTREPGLAEATLHFLTQYERPDIDLIAVTHGPGLEPALWVGINFARALSYAWNVPVVPVNHMEGHILSSIFDGHMIPEIVFPSLALLISGGHTELVVMENWGSYEKVGATRDDAIGEAFDKVARMLGLPYPGGPEISRLAHEAREKSIESKVKLPRPMLDSGDLDFSFSGIKTAVRYAVQDRKLQKEERLGIAREFEDAVTAVLIKKLRMAIERYSIRTIIVGGGVSANTHIRESVLDYFLREYPTVPVYLPPRILSTDNSIMIALAGHARFDASKKSEVLEVITANGNLELGKPTQKT
jgi:N6-L-threonylcarbamoyladenine synthase